MADKEKMQREETGKPAKKEINTRSVQQVCRMIISLLVLGAILSQAVKGQAPSQPPYESEAIGTAEPEEPPAK